MVVSGSLQPEAFRRAPTLIAGQAAGAQGQVRVWAPRKQRFLAPLFVYLLACGFALFSDQVTLLLLMCTVMLLPLLMTMPPPYYFTTDDAGMGITTRKGSLALRWIEISSVQQLHPEDPLTYRLSLRGAEPAQIHLYGYPLAVRRELIALIRQRVGGGMALTPPVEP